MGKRPTAYAKRPDQLIKCVRRSKYRPS